MIRKKLSGNTPKTIKTGIQDMLHLLEQGKNFSGAARIEKQDFHAYVAEIMKNSDEDVRKWLYHLLCLYLDPVDDEAIIRSCLDNVQLELQESQENASWIAAVCAVHAANQSEFEALERQGRFRDFLTDCQIELIASAFRKAPFCLNRVNRQEVYRAIGSGDPITGIWTTKIYSNRFLPIMQKARYRESHIDIPEDMFAELLHHPDDVVRKYTMWAFAQEAEGNLASITKYVPPENARSLESGVLKWYYVKMFQDLSFLQANPDIIEDVQQSLEELKANDREGILIGCGKLGYFDGLANFLVEWEQSDWETNDNVLLRLYEYLAKNINLNGDFREITRYAIKNMGEIPSESARLFLKGFITTEKGRSAMGGNIGAVNAANVQINYGGRNTQINGGADAPEQKKILEEIQKLRASIEKQGIHDEEKVKSVIAHMKYELSSKNQLLENLGGEHVGEMVEELSRAKPKERWKHVDRLLNTLANLVTVVTAAPAATEVREFTEKIISCISGLVG